MTNYEKDLIRYALAYQATHDHVTAKEATRLSLNPPDTRVIRRMVDKRRVKVQVAP